MSTAKELFLKDKENRDKLIAVTKADWFLKAVAFAKAHMLETAALNGDMLTGMRLFESALLTLPETEPGEQDPINSGLSHDQPELKSRQPKPAPEL